MQTSLLKKPRAFSFFLALVLLTVFGVTGAYAAWDKNEDNDAKGYLGVYMQKLTGDISKGLDIDIKRGVLISGVEDGGPADEAGIEDGDVIVEFGGKDVDSPEDLRELVEETPVGDKVEVKLIRDGDEKTVRLVVGERPDKMVWTMRDGDGDFFVNLKDDVHGAVAGLMPGPRLGVKAMKMDDDLASYFDANKDGGILVLEVSEESVAEEAGMKSGDVIQEVDGEKVSSVEEIRRTLKDMEEGDKFDVVIKRHGKKKTLSATMDEQNHFEFLSGGDFHFDRRDIPRVKIKKFDDGHSLFINEKDDLRGEMDELKKELKELKKELKKLKKD